MTVLTTDDRVSIARELWDRAIAIAESLDGSDWFRPTPCAAWDVHDLVAHLGAVQHFLDGGADQPSPPDGWAPPEGASVLDTWTAAGVAARRNWTPEQILAELHTARDGHLERLRTRNPDDPTLGPTGDTTEHGLFAVRCFDLWTHLQDLTVALGGQADPHEDSAPAAAAAEYVTAAIPWMYGKRGKAPEGATLRIRLRPPLDRAGVLAVVEGRARWDDSGDATSDDEVDLTPAALVLLASGRGGPEQWRDRGALSWKGGEGERFVRQARMF